MAGKRIRIRKTQSELDIISQSLERIGKPDMQSYLRQEINRLLTKVSECPELITQECCKDKVSKEYYIPNETYQGLEEIALKMKKPVSTIVDEFFIIPLQKHF